jgi:hypothetical protein
LSAKTLRSRCHPERSEGPREISRQPSLPLKSCGVLRSAQDDSEEVSENRSARNALHLFFENLSCSRRMPEELHWDPMPQGVQVKLLPSRKRSGGNQTRRSRIAALFLHLCRRESLFPGVPNAGTDSMVERPRASAGGPGLQYPVSLRRNSSAKKSLADCCRHAFGNKVTRPSRLCRGFLGNRVSLTGGTPVSLSLSWRMPRGTTLLRRSQVRFLPVLHCSAVAQWIEHRNHVSRIELVAANRPSRGACPGVRLRACELPLWAGVRGVCGVGSRRCGGNSFRAASSPHRAPRRLTPKRQLLRRSRTPRRLPTFRKRA